MAEVLKTSYRLRRDTKENWERLNPVLLAGEPGFITNTYDLKIGDGKTEWNKLPLLGLSQEEINQAFERYFNSSVRIQGLTPAEMKAQE